VVRFPLARWFGAHSICITNLDSENSGPVYRTFSLVGDGSESVRPALAAVITAGFLGLLGGLVVAHGATATSYEVNIYTATPTLFWVGVAVAYLAFFLTVVGSSRSRTVSLGVLLGGGATTAIAGLPLIRGYHFFGHSDSLTHLGWVRSIETGSLNTFEFVYPGTHSLTLVVHQTTGLDVPFSMMLVVLGFVVTFLIFVPLTVYTLTEDIRATAIAGFSGFLLLPINNIATGLPYFPFLLATFFFTVILYLSVKHITFHKHVGFQRISRSRHLATSAVIPVATAAMLFFHPQATMDVIAVLFGVIAAQLFIRRRWPSHPIANTKILLGQFVFISILFFLWSSHQGAAVRTAHQVSAAVGSAIFGGEGGQFGHTAISRQESANEIGVTIVELFVKIFLVSAIYSALAAFAGVASIADWVREARRSVKSVGILLITGGFSLLIVAFLHSFGGISSYLYRHVGFGMVLITVLGTLGLVLILDRIHDLLTQRVAAGYLTVAGGLGVVVAVSLLVLSLLVVFPSPFMYNPGAQVTEAEIDGYRVAVESKPTERWDAPEAVWYGGIRRGPSRYQDATHVKYPVEKRLIFSGPVPNGSLQDLVSHYRTHNETVVRRDHYLPVLQYDYDREIAAYKGIRYTYQGLASVRDQQAVHRIQDNSDITVYYVDVDLYNETDIQAT